MRPSARRDEPWHRQATRGVGMVLAICLGVFLVGLVLSSGALWVMG